VTNQTLISELELNRDNVTLYRIRFTTGKKPYPKVGGGLTDNPKEAAHFTMKEAIDFHAKHYPQKIASFCVVK